MYFNPKVLNSEPDLRYKVDNRPNDTIIYDYQYHDGETFAIEKVTDPIINSTFTANFFKTSYNSSSQQWTDIINNEYEKISN